MPFFKKMIPARILYKSIMARYRFIRNAYWMFVFELGQADLTFCLFSALRVCSLLSRVIPFRIDFLVLKSKIICLSLRNRINFMGVIPLSSLKFSGKKHRFVSIVLNKHEFLVIQAFYLDTNTVGKYTSFCAS